MYVYPFNVQGYMIDDGIRSIAATAAAAIMLLLRFYCLHSDTIVSMASMKCCRSTVLQCVRVRIHTVEQFAEF